MGRHPHKLFTLRMPPVFFSPSWCSLSVQIQEAQDQSPRYEVAVYVPVQKKREKSTPLLRVHVLGWMERLLVAGSPKGAALILRGSEGVSVGQQSLPELRLTVTVEVARRHPRQFHRLVERVLLRWRGCRSAHWWTKEKQARSMTWHICREICSQLQDADAVECMNRAVLTCGGENRYLEANSTGITPR